MMVTAARCHEHSQRQRCDAAIPHAPTTPARPHQEGLLGGVDGAVAGGGEGLAAHSCSHQEVQQQSRRVSAAEHAMQQDWRSPLEEMPRARPRRTSCGTNPNG